MKVVHLNTDDNKKQIERLKESILRTLLENCHKKKNRVNNKTSSLSTKSK